MNSEFFGGFVLIKGKIKTNYTRNSILHHKAKGGVPFFLKRLRPFRLGDISYKYETDFTLGPNKNIFRLLLTDNIYSRLVHKSLFLEFPK